MKSNKAKFSLENHTVQTEGGYLLTLTRVGFASSAEATNSNENNENADAEERTENREKKLPVLFVHGAGATGDLWLLNQSEEKNLPYEMVKKGHDCWLIHLHGTPLSNTHVSHKSKSGKFWDFCWDDMGQQDIPATIEYILKVTGQEKLLYIGYSLGCAVFFMAMSTRPELNQKVELMIALAPAIYLGHTIQAKLYKMAAPLGSFLGKIKLLRRQAFGTKTCKESLKLIRLPTSGNPNKLYNYLCKKIFIISGLSNRNSIDESVVSMFAAEWPKSSSFKFACHAMQLYKSNRFSMYDYGAAQNIKTYGQSIPPDYDIGKVKVPCAIFYSCADRTVSSPGVLQLSSELPNLIGKYEICNPTFAHLDFILQKDVDTLIHEHIFKIFEETLQSS